MLKAPQSIRTTKEIQKSIYLVSFLLYRLPNKITTLHNNKLLLALDIELDLVLQYPFLPFYKQQVAFSNCILSPFPSSIDLGLHLQSYQNYHILLIELRKYSKSTIEYYAPQHRAMRLFYFFILKTTCYLLTHSLGSFVFLVTQLLSIFLRLILYSLFEIT